MDCTAKSLITDSFQQLWQTEARRKQLEQLMVEQLLERPKLAKLWRLMGVRHIVAFALMAMIGDVHRFPSAKRLVGYFGLSPRKVHSGNDAKGREKGRGNTGRGNVRALLIQAAQNAMIHKNSPLQKMGLETQYEKRLQEYRSRRSCPQTHRRHLAPTERPLYTPA